MKSVQEYIEHRAALCESRKEFYDAMDEIATTIMETDNDLLNVDKSWVSRGTWKGKLWANSAHFGNDLAKKLKSCSIITHNEDKEFEVSDFERQIIEVVEEYGMEFYE